MRVDNDRMMKKLTILDLDNTLIYTTYDKNLKSDILFHFSRDMIVYARPFVQEFISKCKGVGDIAVFTTATRDYAQKVCQHLEINPVELFTREDCLIVGFRYSKSVPDYYYSVYDDITIYDDMPDIWDSKSQQKCRIVCVPEFTGDEKDDAVKRFIV